MAREKLDNLVKIARLQDAKNESNSLDGRFDLAYNAAHALSLAALRWHGYRPNNRRYIVFQALEHTLQLAKKDWRVVAEAHERRNRTEYPEIGIRSVRLLRSMARTRRSFRVQSRPPSCKCRLRSHLR